MYDLIDVMKIVRSLLLKFMQSLLKAAMMLNFVMNLQSDMQISVSLISDNRYQFFFVQALSF